MQTKTTVVEDILPVQYGGLDPLFCACPKMYICDILNMPEVDLGKGYKELRSCNILFVNFVYMCKFYMPVTCARKLVYLTCCITLRTKI
jgi:hypothetical protein